VNKHIEYNDFGFMPQVCMVALQRVSRCAAASVSGQDPCHKVGKGCQPMVRWEKSTESLCRLVGLKMADTYTSNRTILIRKNMTHYQILGENEHVLWEYWETVN
jgi:hypothetical protein